MKRKLNRKGFSMVELLVVIGIIVLMVSLTSIAASRYRRSMTAIEMDEAAKSIFIAAQNNLSAAYAQGYPGVSADSFGTKDSNGYYNVLHVTGQGQFSNLSSTGTGTLSVLDLMLPTGAIDENVRTSGNYIIRYQKETGAVLGVFYAEKAGTRFGYTFTEDDFSMFDSPDTLNRTSYGETKAVIGYFDGSDGTRANYDGDSFNAPTLTVDNGNVLSVTVKIPDYSEFVSATDNETVEITFTVTDDETGATKTIVLGTVDGTGSVTPSNDKNVIWDPTTKTFKVIIDDITPATNGDSLRFQDLYKDDDTEPNNNSKKFRPGDDLTFQATATQKKGTEELRTADSNKGHANSIFSNYDPSTGKAEIENARQLENLDPRVSGFDPDDGTPVEVKLTDDIDWSEMGNEPVVYDEGGKKKTTEPGTFLPLEPDYTLTFDGDDHKISDIKVDIEGGGGLFGDLNNEIHIKDLELVDFNIEATDGNAGTLAGTINNSNSTVDGVVAHNTGDDSNLQVTAKASNPNSTDNIAMNAGGLIGQVTKASSIKNSAAAVYVKAEYHKGAYDHNNNNAGGLIGKVNSSTKIYYSYAGGHTVSGRYTATFADGEAGRVNVVGQNTSGGLIGDAGKSRIKSCYSTCSVGNDSSVTTYSGGLIGTKSAGYVQNSYAVGRVVSDKADSNNSGALYGNPSSFIDSNTSGNKYLKNISVNIRDDTADETLGTAVSGKSASDTKFIIPDGSRVTANPYDDILITTYNAKYNFPTIQQLTGSNTKPGITDTHYGDWQLPNVSTTAHYFDNGNTLSLFVEEASLNGANTFTVSITGVTSQKVQYIRVTAIGSTISVKTGTTSDGQNITWTDVTGWPVVKESSGYRLTIDDITTAANLSFNKLFGGAGLIPGEKIEARVAPGESIIDVGLGTAVTTNSLFAFEEEENESGINSSKLTAYISNVRHLQNLEPNVSNVMASSSVSTIDAYVLCNLTWDAPFSTKIYTQSSSVTGSFFGIYNNKIKLFDGGMRTLKGFVVNGDKYGKDCAGLFRSVNSAITIKDVILDGWNVSALTYAGQLVGRINELKANETVVIDTVLAKNSSNSAAVTAKYAGGILGATCDGDCDKTAVITINNSASSVIISGTNAGGIIGYTYQGKYTISNCYAGGHTTDADYSTTNYNITGESYSGGIVGYICSSSFTIKNTFSAASVGGNNICGGIVGKIATITTFDTVYVVAPVKNASSGNGKCGAFLGENKQLTRGIFTNCFYLPEVYGSTTDALKNIRTIGNDAASTYGSGSTTIQAAHYDTDTARTGGNTAISVKSDAFIGKTVKSVAFDSTITAKQYEFPLAVWTSFYCDDDGNRTPEDDNIKTYYGDWKPVVTSPSTTKDVTFFVLKNTSDKVLGTPSDNVKTVISGEDSKVFVPSVQSYYPGYVVDKWYVGPAISDPNNFSFSSWSKTAITYDTATGSVTIPSAYTSLDACSVVVTYVKDDSHYTIQFLYDSTYSNNYTAANSANILQQGSVMYVDKTTKYSNITVPTITHPTKSFIGWYSDASFTNRIDFSSSSKLSGNITAYARFEDAGSYSVTINFKNASGKTLATSVIQYYTILEDLPTIDSNPRKLGYTINKIEKADAASSDITVPSGKKTFTLKEKKNSEYNVIFNTTAEVEVTYSVTFRFENTVASTGSYTSKSFPYSASESYDYTISGLSGTSGTWPTDLKVGGVTYDIEAYTRDTILNNAPGFKLSRIDSVCLVSGNTNEIVVNLSRAQFIMNFDSSVGAYYMPVYVMYGTPIATAMTDSLKSVVPSRAGYELDNSGWTYKKYESKAATGSAVAISESTTMPAHDIIVIAKWNPGTSTYRVEFWFENANDSEYSYVGSTSASGTTGTSVSSSTAKDSSNTLYKDYNNKSHSTTASHVCDYRCYSDTSSSKLSYTSNSSCEGGGYWAYGSSIVNFNPGGSRSNGDIAAWTYKDTAGGGKAIYVNGTWYIYTGSETSHLDKNCSSTGNFNWTDNTHFTFNSNKIETVEIEGDGSTVLHVYYSRNKYTLTVTSSRNGTTFSHNCSNGDCINYFNDYVNHVHTASCYNCGFYGKDHSHTDTCWTTVTLPAKSNCHTHTLSCYTSNSYSVATNSDSYFSNIKSSYGSNPSEGYIYVYIDKGRSSGTGYFFFYTNGTWYNLGSYHAGSCSDVASKFKNNTGFTYYDSSSSEGAHRDSQAQSCTRHTHTASCFEVPSQYSGKSGQFVNAAKGTYKYISCTTTVHVHQPSCVTGCTAYQDAKSKQCLLKNTTASSKSTIIIIEAKYEQDIGYYFPVISTGGTVYSSSTYNDVGDKVFDAYTSRVDTMPGVSFTLEEIDYGTGASYSYYLEVINDTDEGSTFSGISGKYYLYYKDTFSSGYYYTYEEDFIAIDGFSRYAAYDRYNNEWKTSESQYSHSSAVSTRDACFFYKRNAYQLLCHVGSTVTDYSVKYQASILNVLPTNPKLTGDKSDYVFVGWYLDEDYTEGNEVTSSTTMPLSNASVYAKFVPPTMTVNFDLNGGSWTTSGVQASLTCYKGETIEKQITNEATGLLLDKYKPTKSGTEFLYWYYEKDGKDVQFVPSAVITETPLNLKAKWGDSSKGSVYYLYVCKDNGVETPVKNEDGTDVAKEFKGADYIVGQRYTFGDTAATQPRTFAGYMLDGTSYPEIQIAAGDNYVTFYYRMEKTWSYTVQYYISADGVNYETYGSAITSGSLGIYDTAVVEFKLPSEYSTYRLAKFEYNGTVRTDGVTSVKIAYGSGDCVVKFYMSPDPEALKINIEDRERLNDKHSVYNGSNYITAATSKVTVSNQTLYKLPDALNAKTSNLIYTYTYYDLSTDTKTTNATNAGSYGMDVKVELEIVSNSGTKTTVKLYETTDHSLRLVIDPCTVTVESAGGEWAYTPGVTHRNESVTVTGASAADEALIKNSIVWTADAFRIDIGESENAFIVKFADGEGLSDNYRIETKFGKLKVYWNYTIQTLERYDFYESDAAISTVLANSTTKQTNDLTSKTEHTVYSSSVDIKLELSDTDYAKFKDYYRVVYRYNGREEILGSVADILNKGKTVRISPITGASYADGASTALEIIVEIDPDKVSSLIPTIAEFTYDGTSKAMDTSVKLTLDTGVTFFCRYNYFDEDLNKITTNIVNAGTYYTDAYLFMSYNGSNYIVAKNSNKQVKLVINPRRITLTSAAATVTIGADGTIPEYKSSIKATSPDGAIAFINPSDPSVAPKLSKVISYTFKPGSDFAIPTCNNYFAYTWKSGYNPDNYDVTVVYGTMTVKWQAKVQYSLRLTSVDGTLEGYTFDKSNPVYTLGSATTRTFDGTTGSVAATGLVSGLKAVSYTYNNVTRSISGDTLTLSPNRLGAGQYGKAELSIVFEIDTSALALADKTVTYDGKAQGVNALAATYAVDIDNLGSCEYEAAKTSTVYVYMQNGEVVDKPTNAGDYYVKAYRILTLSDNSNAEDAKFLLWCDESATKKLCIKPIEVTFTSADDKVTLDGDTVIRTAAGSATPVMTGTCAEGESLICTYETLWSKCKKDSKYVNKFTVAAGENTNISNYKITYVYGSLTK